MVDDQRCLTDLLVRDLQPLLTPGLAAHGFQETAVTDLNPYEQQRLGEIDQQLVYSGRDFRDSGDRLIYSKERALLQVRKYPRRNSTLYDVTHPFGLVFRFDLEDHADIGRDSAARLIPTDEGLQAVVNALTQQLDRRIYLSRADSVYCSSDGVATTFWQAFEPEELPLDPKRNQLYFTLWFQVERKPRGFVEGEVKQRDVADTVRSVAFITNFVTAYMNRELHVYDEMKRIDRAFAAGMSLSLGQ